MIGFTVKARVNNHAQFINQAHLKEVAAGNGAAFEEHVFYIEILFEVFEGTLCFFKLGTGCTHDVGNADFFQFFLISTSDMASEDGNDMFAAGKGRRFVVEAALDIEYDGKRPAFAFTDERIRLHGLVAFHRFFFFYDISAVLGHGFASDDPAVCG